MFDRFWIAALVGVGACTTTPASARSVALETFDQNSKPEFVLSARQDQKASSKVIVGSSNTDSSDALAQDFSEIGSGPAYPLPAPIPIRPIQRSVPAWMATRGGQGARSGFRYFQPPKPTIMASRLSLAFNAGENTPGCSRAIYRPKGLRAEIEVRRSHYYALMAEIACEVGVPVNLFDALLTQESGYNPHALSPKGAMGIAQLMPGTARTAGVAKPWDIEDNMRGGARVLKMHLAEFGRYDLALAAYNAGAGRVRETGRVPRIRETTAYVRSILSDVSRQFAAEAAY